MPQPERGLPVPKSMNAPIGEGTRGEFASDTDAAPLADQDTPELTKWDVEKDNRDAKLARVDPAVTNGEHSVVGYDNSEPERLEDAAPVAFECIGVGSTPGSATLTHPGQRRG